LGLNLEKEFAVFEKLIKKDWKACFFYLATAVGLGFWLGGEWVLACMNKWH